jgi:hypothetical protein
VHVLAPTLLEYCAARCTMPTATLSWSGVGLARWKGVSPGTAVVVCGLAGALAPDMAPGTVLVPERIGMSDGEVLQCDVAITEALVRGARARGLKTDARPLLTARTLVSGSARRDWAGHGYAATDMETGLLAGRGLRVATVRVVLDGPGHEISPNWLRPMSAMRQPRLWSEMLWLCRYAPYFALRAARVLRGALEELDGYGQEANTRCESG